MARKQPVPDSRCRPPIPRHRRWELAWHRRRQRSQTLQQPELPDLLEAFWNWDERSRCHPSCPRMPSGPPGPTLSTCPVRLPAHDAMNSTSVPARHRYTGGTRRSVADVWLLRCLLWMVELNEKVDHDRLLSIRRAGHQARRIPLPPTAIRPPPG